MDYYLTLAARAHSHIHSNTMGGGASRSPEAAGGADALGRRGRRALARRPQPVERRVGGAQLCLQHGAGVAVQLVGRAAAALRRSAERGASAGHRRVRGGASRAPATSTCERESGGGVRGRTAAGGAGERQLGGVWAGRRASGGGWKGALVRTESRGADGGGARARARGPSGARALFSQTGGARAWTAVSTCARARASREEG